MSSRRLVFPALITAGLLWGTTVPLSKLALTWLPPAWLAFCRFGLAAAILMVICRLRRRQSELRAAMTPAILGTGAIGYGASVVLQNIGVQHTSVTHAALLIGTMPALVAIIAAISGHGMARPMAWAGFALSLGGVAIVAAGKGGGSSLYGDGLVLAAQLVSAAFVVSQARILRDRDPVAVSAVQLLAAAALTLPMALLTEGRPAGHASSAALLATGALVLAGTVAPTALFAFGQSRVRADVAGAFVNLEPLVGAIAGTVLFADPLGPAQLAGGAAIIAGIGLSSLQAIRARRPAPADAGVPAQAGRRAHSFPSPGPRLTILRGETCSYGPALSSRRSALLESSSKSRQKRRARCGTSRPSRSSRSSSTGWRSSAGLRWSHSSWYSPARRTRVTRRPGPLRIR